MEGARMLQLSVIITILSLFLNIATAVDTISSSQPLTRDQTIVSAGQVFELGFFSPENSNKWFIGIWYKKFPTKPKTVVWVANRDNPLSSCSGTLKIGKNRKLIITDESGKIIWQSNQTTSSSNTVGQILDTGNFVVRRENDSDPRNYLWQSFDYPTDTLLPGMKLGLDKKTGLNRFLTSWKNKDDPSIGDFFFKININGFPEFILWQNQIEVYRSGPWNGVGFSGVPGMSPSSIMNFTFVMNKDENSYSFEMTDSFKYSRLLLNPFGVLQRFIWLQTREKWNILWFAPSDQCDTYRECGAFAICDTNNSTVCGCMKGFHPRNEQEWNLGDWSEGCVRADKPNSRNDGFKKISNLKLPESSNAVFSEGMSLEDCRINCRRNYSCTAFASKDIRSRGSGCMTWMGDLTDLRQYTASKGGQVLFLRVPKKLDEGKGLLVNIRLDHSDSLIDRILDRLKTFLETWDLRTVILLSLFLQIILIFLAPFRKRVSSLFLTLPMWLAYLLADITATFALGIIAKSQTHKAIGPYADPDLLALWAPFLLVHLGGPDTITAFALEDNELWLRHSLNLMFHGWAVSYSFVRAFPNKRLWLPTLLMIVAGLIKYVERTRSLYLASIRRFRSSLLTEPDPGPNYAKLMGEYSSKKLANLPTKIVMIPEPKRAKTTAPEVIELTDLEIVQAAHKFFDTFKGLIADLIFSFRERAESRGFFLQRTPRDAFKVVEVELNFIYEILYTKVVVVQRTLGYIFRFVTIGLTCASLVLFVLVHKHKIEPFDIGVTYTLLIGAIALDAVAFIMALTSDWTTVILTKYDNTLFKYLGAILRVDRNRWPNENQPDNKKPEKKQPDDKQPEKKQPDDKQVDKKQELNIFSSPIMSFVAKYVGFKKYRELISRRWSGSISRHNLLHYCLNPRHPKFLDQVISWLGLTYKVDSFQYVDTKKIDNEIRDVIFYELKMKAEVADDLETSKEIQAARGDWTLRVNGHYDLLPWINDVDYDESLLLWHIATDLCYSETEVQKYTNVPNYRRFAKILSDHMLYLLMMQSTMMSTVAGIGEIRFRDTCAEAKKFFVEKGIKKKGRDNRKEEIYELDETHVTACQDLLKVETEVKPVAVKGDRSKSVLFDACMLAKKLKEMEAAKKWEIMSKVWVELLCYAASRCRPTTHVAQLSKGGQFITLVWLLMTHFGLGDQFQISEGHARAKLIVGK